MLSLALLLQLRLCLAMLLPQPAVELDGYRYLLNVPAGSSSRAMPLHLFLHGYGDVGDDIDILRIREGVTNLLDKFEQGQVNRATTLASLEFITVSPLHPNRQPHLFDWESDKLMKILNKVMSEHAIDKQRIYISGHSMGAFGTWRNLIANPTFFTAAVPLAGALRGWELGHGWPDVSDIIAIPIWAFHGTADGIINVRLAEESDAHMKKAGSKVCRLTILPEEPHNIGTSVWYRNDGEVLEWMLQQSK